MRDVDGNAQYCSARGEPLFDVDGRFLGYRGTANDISVRVRSEVAMRRFRAAMDTTSDAIYLTDRTHMCFFDVNEAACRMQGATRAELLARGPSGILTQSIEELAQTYDAIIAGGATEPLEMLSTATGGAQVCVELRRAGLHTTEGWMIFAVVSDIP